MLLHIHKGRTDSLSLIHVANDFLQGSDHRHTLFGTLTDSDVYFYSSYSYLNCCQLHLHVFHKVTSFMLEINEIMWLLCPLFSHTF